jgi:hypothetical protein
VPADSSTRRILRHHELLKRLGRYATDLACNVGERQKVIGNARIGARLLACEDIPVPEGVYAAIALMAVKFERLQGRGSFRRRSILHPGYSGNRQAAQAPRTGRPCCRWDCWCISLKRVSRASNLEILLGGSTCGERTACRRATALPIGAERVRARKESLSRQAWTKFIGPRKSILPTSTPPLRRTAYVIAMWK